VFSPGAIETEAWDSFGGGDRKQQIVDLYKSKTLLGTVGKPGDMAEAYLYLMRDAKIWKISFPYENSPQVG
jgi:NAD(P)-dependent dehydrogenase (short-subunit alcohol dehydrogenase family)